MRCCLFLLVLVTCLYSTQGAAQERALADSLESSGSQHRDRWGSRQAFARKYLFGAVSGVIHAGAGVLASALIIEKRCEEGVRGELDFCGFAEVVIGSSLGYVVGSAVGVHMTGRSAGERVPFAATLVGSTLGFGLGIGLTAWQHKSWPSVLLLPPLGAVLMHDSRRSDVRAVPATDGARSSLERMRIGFNWNMNAPRVVMNLRL